MILRDSTCSLDTTCHSTAWVCQRGNPICNEPVSFREESVESISGHSWGVYLSPQRFQPGTGRQLRRVANHTAPLAYKTTNPHLSGFCPSQASIRVIDYFMRQRSGSNNSLYSSASYLASTRVPHTPATLYGVVWINWTMFLTLLLEWQV